MKHSKTEKIVTDIFNRNSCKVYVLTDKSYSSSFIAVAASNFLASKIRYKIEEKVISIYNVGITDFTILA